MNQANCIFNFIDCLVMKKDRKNQMVLNQHERIVIISAGKVQENGKIKKMPKAE